MPKLYAVSETSNYLSNYKHSRPLSLQETNICSPILSHQPETAFSQLQERATFLPAQSPALSMELSQTTIILSNVQSKHLRYCVPLSIGGWGPGKSCLLTN